MPVRRGVGCVITLLVFAIAVSIGGLVAMWLLVGASRRCPRTRRSCCNLATDRHESSPDDVFRQVCGGGEARSLRSVVEALRKAKVDRRVRRRDDRPTGLSVAGLWGKVQEIRDAILDFRNAGKPVVAYLEYGGDREYYLATACRPGLPDAVEPARSHRRRHLRAVPARHARQDRRVSGHAPHRRVQDGASTSSPRRRYTPAHREMDESLNRDTVRTARRAGSPTAGRRPKRRSARWSTRDRSCPRTRCAPDSSTTSRTRTRSTTS